MTAAVLPLVERRSCDDCGAAMSRTPLARIATHGEWGCRCGLRLALLAPTPPGGWPVFLRSRKLSDRGST